MQLGLAELNDETALKMSASEPTGGGRPKALEIIEGLDEAFLRVVKQHTAESLTDETLKWTNLTSDKLLRHSRQRFKSIFKLKNF
jgi:hypothetical protein